MRLFLYHINSSTLKVFQNIAENNTEVLYEFLGNSRYLLMTLNDNIKQFSVFFELHSLNVTSNQ